MRTILFISCFLLFTVGVYSQDPLPVKGQKYTISGFIRDNLGEELLGANIYIENLGAGTISNIYGFYSLTLPQGIYNLRCSYIGFGIYFDTITLQDNIHLNILLEEETQRLDKVEIRSKTEDVGRQPPEMGIFRLHARKINEIPALLGESDLVKTIQMLPGIMAPGEGLSGFVVRGGNYDQNLILLDEAPVYNPSHLMGFFSVFNNEVVKDVHVYKGAIPARYGGRLSSLFDIRLREGKQTRFGGSAGIGTISSKIILEGPLFNKRGSFILSGRRSYADIFLPLSSDEEVKDNRIYFYDLNFKANYRINDKNRIFLSSYTGNDVFAYQKIYYMTWGNLTETIRWNHLFSNRLFSNLSLIYSRYRYRLGQSTDITGVEWNSELSNTGLKYDFSFYPNPGNTIRFGFSANHFFFRPGYIR
ncbi:MAG: carboxypeptidase-like regulatory domain-containing protein, partial [Bacteroidales bacterium]